MIDDLNMNILQKLGIKKLRPWQESVLPAAVRGDDVFVMVSTGGGKSMIPQYLSAVDGNGMLTLNLSPNRALQKDQLENLKGSGIKAALLNSDLSAVERSTLLKNLRAYRMLYCAPEQLLKEDLLEALERVTVARVVVDEVHVLTEVKHQFRPAYGKIGEFIRSCSPRPQVIALTATATPTARKEIKSDLSMRADTAMFVYPIRRDNLKIQAKHIKSSAKSGKNAAGTMLREVESILKKWNGKGTVIIYATTVKQVNQAKKHLSGRGYQVKKITGKMTAKKRRKSQDAFIHNECRIIVATNAFGLGINKADVRLVVHMGLPLTIEGYVQEIGRAGRDGKESNCILLYTDGDYQRNKRILQSGGEESFSWFKKGLEAMRKFSKNRNKCAWQQLEKYFGEKPHARCGNCANCIVKKFHR